MDEMVLKHIRPDVIRFALAMELKLRKHDDDRNGWANTDINWLFKRLQQEMNELGEAIIFDGYFSGLPDEESIDVGNFAMMIFSNSSRKTLDDLISQIRGPWQGG